MESSIVFLVLAIFAFLVALASMWVRRTEKYHPMPDDIWNQLQTSKIYHYFGNKHPITQRATTTPTFLQVSLEPRRPRGNFKVPVALYAYLGHQSSGAVMNHYLPRLRHLDNGAVIAFDGSQLGDALEQEDVKWRQLDGAIAITKPVKVTGTVLGGINPYKARRSSQAPV